MRTGPPQPNARGGDGDDGDGSRTNSALRAPLGMPKVTITP